MSKIIPVLLAGGSGTRLWPLSRKSYPKQFSTILNKNSLFQQSVIRLLSSKEVTFDELITITNSNFRFIVLEQLENIKVNPGSIIIEPLSKNTGPAILAACLHALKDNKDAIMLIAPSDHIIDDLESFHKSISIALNEAKKNKIVTFGIAPTKPETGYGYLELEKKSKGEAVKLKNFIEKPNLKNAELMFSKQNFMWNAGIFMFKAKEMIDSFKKFHSEIFYAVEEAIQKGKPDLKFFRLAEEPWSRCADISIDYAIMEKANNLVAVPLFNHWSDLGGWDSVWKEMKPDINGVAVSKNAHAIECKNTLLRSENENQEVVGLGLDNILAITMTDAVLIAHKDQAQNVKTVVKKLKTENIMQAEIFPKDFRPWGWFETLALGGRFQVKRISVKPGAALSLQSHHHRSEHWIVVEGTAKVTVDKKTKLITEGQSIYIPLGAVHRMENPGKVPMLLIEVQTGTYLKEDDIVRYEDLYSRK